MKRIIATLVAFLLAISPAYSAATSLADKLAASVVLIQIGEQGACTGFVIDNERDFVLTAAHCDVKGVDTFVDLAPSKVQAKDIKNDLLVLKVEGIDKPGLKLAKGNPAIGDEVISYGYGYGLNQPLFRVAHISADKLNLPGFDGDFFALDSTFVPGQSGGPVVNSKGDVVMIVQLGSESVGFGRGAEVIGKSLGKYFENQAK